MLFGQFISDGVVVLWSMIFAVIIQGFEGLLGISERDVNVRAPGAAGKAFEGAFFFLLFLALSFAFLFPPFSDHLLRQTLPRYILPFRFSPRLDGAQLSQTFSRKNGKTTIQYSIRINILNF